MTKFTKQQLVEESIKKGILMSPEMLEKADLDHNIETTPTQDGNTSIGVDEKPVNANGKKVKVVLSYEEEDKKFDINDFIGLFNTRFRQLESMLRQRQELKNLLSISRAIGKREREEVSVIGMVQKKEINKNGNIIINLEDPTGEITTIINKNKRELFDQAQEVVLDSVIGLTGTGHNRVIFANNIIQPEIPFSKELRKSPTEEYAVFLSDMHVGSNLFLEDSFKKFLKWINGEIGNEGQRELAKKIKYLFIIGDLVDGVGIYPGQEEELLIKDIYKQYEKCAELLSHIPKYIQIIICGGNHDAMRVAEPQPLLYKDFAGPIWELENVTLVSNPAVVNIGQQEGFSGFDVLMYHGYSFDYYVANVDKLRNQGGYDRPDLIMRFLLQKRHLAPSHTSTLYLPTKNKDYLFIENAPDFFVTGHIHKSSVSNYRNITLICGSCWQAKTSFQEKVGHHPEPSRVPIVNLQTRKARILRF